MIASLKRLREEIVTLVQETDPEAWSSPAYEDGWTARDVLAHIASTCAPASFLLSIARTPGGGPAGAGSYDVDLFNRQQTEMRAGRSPQQLLDEIRSTMQRDIEAVEDASDELISKHLVAPWGAEGELGELIILSAEGHLGGHVADLRGSLRR